MNWFYKTPEKENLAERTRWSFLLGDQFRSYNGKHLSYKQRDSVRKQNLIICRRQSVRQIIKLNECFVLCHYLKGWKTVAAMLVGKPGHPHVINKWFMQTCLWWRNTLFSSKEASESQCEMRMWCNTEAHKNIWLFFIIHYISNNNKYIIYLL